MEVSMVEKILAEGYRPVEFGSLELGRQIRLLHGRGYLNAEVIEKAADGGTAECLDFGIMCLFETGDIVYVKD